MKAIVFQFPTKGERDWSIIETSLRDALSSAGAPAAVIDRVAKEMQRYFDDVLKLDLRFDFPISFPRGLTPDQTSSISAEIGRALEVKLTDITSKLHRSLFAERFHRELDICHELGLW